MIVSYSHLSPALETTGLLGALSTLNEGTVSVGARGTPMAVLGTENRSNTGSGEEENSDTGQIISISLCCSNKTHGSS